MHRENPDETPRVRREREGKAQARPLIRGGRFIHAAVHCQRGERGMLLSAATRGAKKVPLLLLLMSEIDVAVAAAVLYAHRQLLLKGERIKT